MELGAVSENHFSLVSLGESTKEKERGRGRERGGRLKIERMNYDARNKLAN